MTSAIVIASNFLEQVESFRARPYLDSVSRWTIGYGTTFLPSGAPVLASTPEITEDVAGAYLMHDLVKISIFVSQCTKTKLTNHQLAAIYSFCYNEGNARFASSTMLRKINVPDLAAAYQEFPKWDKGHVDGKLVDIPGLLNRRHAEMRLWCEKD